MSGAAPGPLRLAVDAAALVRDRRGMGRIVRATVTSALDDEAFEVTLLAGGRDARALRAQYADVEIRPARSAQRRGRFDVVWYPFNGMRFACAAPSLVMMHDAFAFTEPARDAVARSHEQAPMRRAARCATRVMVNSAWTRGEVARELSLAPEALAIVRPAPDAFFFPAADETLPPPLRARRFVLIVGVREPRKNARLAIDACALALRAPDETLVIAGELGADDRERVRRLRVPAGEIAASDAMLRALYRNAAAVLVPSRAEGFGLVAVEAMACGAPVLAADHAALPEATAGAAELLDPDNPWRWARAIRTLLDNPERTAALGARGATRFAQADRGAPVRETLALLRDTAQIGIDRRART